MTPQPPITNMWGDQISLQSGEPISQQGPPSPVPHPPNWFEHWQHVSSGQDLPDSVYDAQREKFFEDNIVPWAMQSGTSPAAARDSFMHQTERPNKSSMPRTSLVLREAAKSLVAPTAVLGASPETFGARGAAQEAQRQDINPAPYKMLGQALGQAPYWAAGMGAAGALGEAFELAPLGTKMLMSSTGAIIQGSYDAAKAKAGERASAGLEGAVEGGAATAAFEFAGPLWKFLQNAEPSLTDGEAQAVEAVAKGQASVEQHAEASTAIIKTPDIDQKIAEHVDASTKLADKVGMPDAAVVQGADGRVRVQLRTAEGTAQWLGGSKGAKPEDYQKVLDKLTAHLDAGGSLLQVIGDTSAQRSFLDLLGQQQTKAVKVEGMHVPEPVPVNDVLSFQDWVDWADRLGISRNEIPDLLPSELREGYLAYLTTEAGVPEALVKPPEPDNPDWFLKDSNPEALEAELAKHREANTPGMNFGRGLEEGGAEQGSEVEADYKQTPLWHRFAGQYDFLPEGTFGATVTGEAGTKPTMFLQPGNMMEGNDLREGVWHEGMHGLMNYTGLGHVLADLNDHTLVRQIWNRGLVATSPDTYGAVPGIAAEEVYTYAAQAVRHNNTALLEHLGNADESTAHVLDWVTQTSNDLKEALAEKGDSLHRRVFERRLNSVISKSTSMIEDIRAAYGHDLDISLQDGRWVATEPNGTSHIFNKQSELGDFLHEKAAEPVNTPELVDTSILPDGISRFGRNMAPPSNSKAPITTDPPPPDSVNLGPQYFSRFIRPFDGWISTVAEKIQNPELYNAFYAIRDKYVDFNNYLRPYTATLKDTLGDMSRARRSDVYSYIAGTDSTARATALQAANFTTDEFRKIMQFENDFEDTGLFDYLRKTVPKLRAQNWDTSQLFPKGQDKGWMGRLLRSGQLDPRDTDLLSISAAYVRGKAFHEQLAPYVDAAESLVKDTDELSMLKPILRRQIEYYRGIPDYTQKVVANTLNAALDAVVSGIDKLNGKLPSMLQIPTDGLREMTGSQAMAKYILFSYAGGLLGRPAVVVRDALQVLLTTLPVLGPKYLMKGMARAFESSAESGMKDAFRIAQNAGWFIERAELPEMIAGGGDQLKGSFSDTVQKGLSAIRWSHNSNRLIAGWGHVEKTLDALPDLAATGDIKQFAKASDAWFMSSSMRDKWLQQAQVVAQNPDRWQEFAVKMARDLLETTQWNYTRGGMPGIYTYQLGRLFGQYGTWPLNYIEYARRFVTAAADPTYRSEAIKAMTTLTLAHGAVLSAGQSVGIDTAHWVFTQPMAYSGGPLFQAVSNVPATFDFESYRGAEARQEMKELFYPGLVPGGVEMESLRKMIAEDDPNVWAHILGFTPLEEKEKLHGYHKFVP